MSSFRHVRRATLISLLLTHVSQSLAEPPMQVDDAGTLEMGKRHLESAYQADRRMRGVELVYGFAPIDHLEINLLAAVHHDHEPNPASRLNGGSIGFKWVPWQNESGWSWGLKLDLNHLHVDDRANAARHIEKRHALMGLASYRFADGQITHLNLGLKRMKAEGAGKTVGTWGLGHEFPLAENLMLTAEIFGERHARPDKALGLRYTVAEGFKISGAVGHGNSRRFGQLGFAWEF